MPYDFNTSTTAELRLVVKCNKKGREKVVARMVGILLLQKCFLLVNQKVAL